MEQHVGACCVRKMSPPLTQLRRRLAGRTQAGMEAWCQAFCPVMGGRASCIMYHVSCIQYRTDPHMPPSLPSLPLLQYVACHLPGSRSTGCRRGAVQANECNPRATAGIFRVQRTYVSTQVRPDDIMMEGRRAMLRDLLRLCEGGGGAAAARQDTGRRPPTMSPRSSRPVAVASLLGHKDCKTCQYHVRVTKALGAAGIHSLGVIGSHCQARSLQPSHRVGCSHDSNWFHWLVVDDQPKVSESRARKRPRHAHQ